MTNFNIAEGVDKPLASVAESVDLDDLVISDRVSEGSVILPGASLEAASILKVVQLAVAKTIIRRRG